MIARDQVNIYSTDRFIIQRWYATTLLGKPKVIFALSSRSDEWHPLAQEEIRIPTAGESRAGFDRKVETTLQSFKAIIQRLEVSASKDRRFPEISDSVDEAVRSLFGGPRSGGPGGA